MNYFLIKREQKRTLSRTPLAKIMDPFNSVIFQRSAHTGRPLPRTV